MRRLIAALAVLALTACISDSVGIVGTQVTGGGEIPTGIAGTYTLRTVGGVNLPFSRYTTLYDKAEVLDDAMTLTNANTWSELRHERHTTAGVATTVTLTNSGTFVRGSTGDMVFNSPDVSTFDGTLVGTTLTLYLRDPAGQLLPAVLTK